MLRGVFEAMRRVTVVGGARRPDLPCALVATAHSDRHLNSIKRRDTNARASTLAPARMPLRSRAPPSDYPKRPMPPQRFQV